MEYVTVRVSTLRGDQKIRFNVYVKINEKMILYIRDGDSFEGPRLKRLKEKKLKKLFIMIDDETKYRDYLLKNIEQAYDSKEGDLQTRAEIVQGAQQNCAEDVFDNPENAENYNFAKENSAKYVQFLLSNSDSVSSILNMENTDQSIAHHGVNVSTLAVALAHKMGIADPKQTQLLALGALLHDFGHSLTNVSPAKPLSSMSVDELTIYKAHPEQGAMKVQDKKHFDPTVINILMKHEECIDGSGYPHGAIEKDIDPLIQIVSSANTMDRMITFEGTPRHEVAKRLMVEKMGKHPLKHLQFLSELAKSL